MSIPFGVLKRISELEPLPTPLARVLEAARSSSTLRGDLIDHLESMPEVATRIRATANAADRADLPTVERFAAAVARLGVMAVLQIAFDQHLRRLRTPAPAYGLSKHDVWLHSTAASLAAQEYLRRRRRWEGQGIAPIAASLHDAGKMVISAEYGSGAWRMVDWRHRRKVTVVEAEQAVFRCTHAEVGAEMARRWGLGEEVAQAIAAHHQPGTSRSSSLSDLVRFADLVASGLGVGCGSAGLVFPHDADCAKRLKIKPREQSEIRTSVAESMALLARR